MNPTQHLPGSQNLAFVEALYADFQRDPRSVPEDWATYFAGLRDAETSAASPASADAAEPVRLGPSFKPRGVFDPGGEPRNGTHAARAQNGHGPTANGAATNGAAANGAAAAALAAAHSSAAAAVAAARPAAQALQDRVDQIVRAYRVLGHFVSKIDPLGIERPTPPELDPAFYGFTERDLDKRFSVETIEGLDGHVPLRQILERLHNTYCRSIGVQFMHIDDFAARRWLQERMERTSNRIELTRAHQMRILTRLTDAVIFEEFIRRKFVGAKSFSLEGGESLIPLLDLAIEKAGEQGVAEIVMGMAHRGRLNVLANILGKHPAQIFREFADTQAAWSSGQGDVKYHLGWSRDYETGSGARVHLTLSFNPSHLEFVNPVVLGRVRAKQDRRRDTQRSRVLPLIIHGDAAFAGEGIIQETLNLSQLAGYEIGGCLHVIVNNQIGFTTSPTEGRSTMYASDVARMLQVPIFHVNGEDPEAVAACMMLAMDFRKQFRRDVIVDMYCFRRLGHNEGDEPSFTQPLMYKVIEKRKSVREGYLSHLLSMGGVSREEADDLVVRRTKLLEDALSQSRSEEYVPGNDSLHGVWEGYFGGPEKGVPEAETAVPHDVLQRVLLAQSRVPDGFHPHPKVERLLHARAEMARGEKPLDWAMAEGAAFGSLLVQGVPLRLSGQDVGRGTFSQRHAVLHDYESGAQHVALRHIDEKQAGLEIINSPLSEAGVLGFDYGYSLDTPDGLTMWEAQFGDFVNVAQVIIDQFISSAEDKWRRLSGLVMLLPHGFEGQGPEHSSARVERFLMMGASDNIQVIYPSTPAQYFHCLRRQALRRWRKPMVVITPKSLLRNPACVSVLADFETGGFQRLIPDATPGASAGPVERVLVCTGKIYYELVERREKLGRTDIAIVRLEQLYPLPDDLVPNALSVYPDGTPIYWVQEEPENMGAWRYLRVRLGERIAGRWPLHGVTRPASASPATGSHSTHKREQDALISKAFGES